MRADVVDEAELLVLLPRQPIPRVQRVQPPQRRGADQQQADDHCGDLDRHFSAQSHGRLKYSRTASAPGLFGKAGNFCAGGGGPARAPEAGAVKMSCADLHHGA
jgi:hypothetical protein